MPAKSKNTKKEKRTYRKRSVMRIVKQPIAPVAQKQVVKMLYSETLPLNALGIGQAVTCQFRANSIFDPNFTGVGHQPMGHDQWSAFYNHYCVVSSKCRVDYLPQSTAIGGNFIGAIRISPDSAPSTIPAIQLFENRQAVTGICMTAGRPLRLNNTYNMYKQFGIKPGLSTTCTAAFGANPVEDCYFHVSICPYDSSVQAQSFVIVLIEYTVLLLEPRTLSES